MINSSVESSFPLTPVQQGMLFHHVEQPESGVDIQQLVASLDGRFDTRLFLESWRTVTILHASLRTRFQWEDGGEPRQKILCGVELLSEEEDLSSLPVGEQHAHISAFLQLERRRGFDLAQAPLSRLRFFRLNESELRLVWTFHHIILDSGSVRIVLSDVFTAYEALLSGNEVSLEASQPFSEFIESLEARAEKQVGDQAFFREQLKGFTAVNELSESVPESMDLVRPADRFFHERSFELSKELSGKLREVATGLGVTLNTCIQTAWALVISDFSSGANDVVFGVLRSGRHSKDSDASKQVGLFINTIPVRIHIDREQTLAQMMCAVHQTYVALTPHKHAALVDIQAVSEIPGGEALFESVLDFNDDRFDRLEALPKGITRCHFEWIEQTNYPITLCCYAEPELELKLVWNPAHLEERLAEGVIARLRVAIEAMAEKPETQLKHLVLQSAQEREWIASHSDTRADYDENACMHHFFERQCRLTLDSVALVHRAEEISYFQLNARANSVAVQLRGLGVGPDVLVGLYMDRSIDMVAGLFGILKAGGAYVPLDPDYPSERIAIMLEGCSVVLTQEKLQAQLPPCDIEILLIESIQDCSEAVPETGVTSSNLAYVIYTSGSAGRPKGTMVEHRNVSNFFTGMDQCIGTEPGVWLAVTSISFDISVLELFWTLGRGFKVVLHDELTTAALQRSSAQPETGVSQPMDFGLFFFGSDASSEAQNRYRLLLDSARFADQNGFSSVWTPERHFHKFGGIFPNPAVTGAALATITKRIQIRAGSCVMPLQNPIRVAEEWAVVDNLSGGRVGLSFASGWHVDDFALHPENYTDRKRIMFEGIDTVRALWRGEAVEALNGHGEKIAVNIFPPSIQKEPPIWITAAGNTKTFEAAGEMGANLLTNLLGQNISELAEKLSAYRAAWDRAGHAGTGKVSLMLHTFIGEDEESVREMVREPFMDYLRTATDLVKKAKWYLPSLQRSEGRGEKDGGDGAELDELTPEETDAVMNHAFERYFQTSGLFGSPESCLKMVNELKSVGVTEIGCLIDFGVPIEDVLESLPQLNQLRKLSNEVHSEAEVWSIPAQIERHDVTHLQCTPSLAQVVIESPEIEQSIRQIQTIMLGGETLPNGLAQRILELLPENGRLLNMYGPTETTIWSTVAKLSANQKVTIGTPIANTSIHLLDSRLAPVPIGTVGELYVGGAGVVRGYLQRPDLTAERFLPGVMESGGRMYRTGDRVRYLPNGNLEFLGRFDDQVKLSGHRIELGEIETALARHRGVGQAVVVAREDNTGNSQLVAYIRRQMPDAFKPTESSNSQVEQWKKIWQQIYEESTGGSSAEPLITRFNTAGWNSSFTGLPISLDDMQEWVNETTANIAALKPKRLLEIGSGTGLLLFRLAPQCERYTGVDFCSSALTAIKPECDRLGLKQVELFQSSADDLSGIPDGLYDVVVINSVVQYFPDADYLETVLVNAVDKLTPGGSLFIGDVRDLDLLSAFHVSLELSFAPDDMSLSQFKERLASRAQLENELLISSDYFGAFARKHGLDGLSVTIKRGISRNEMNDFRYDVVLRKAGGETLLSSPIAQVIDGSSFACLDQLSPVVLEASGSLRVTRLLNARLVEAVRAQEFLDSERTGEVSNLREALVGVLDSAIHPQQVYDISPNFDVSLSFSDNDGLYFDAEFTPKNRAQGRFRILPVETHFQPKQTPAYVNTPATTTDESVQPPELQAALMKALPDFMVPSAFVFLDAFPLTPNGKVDRNALPAPEAISNPVDSATPIAAPANELEQSIAQVWLELLNLEHVDVNEDFFKLGANSLLVMRAANRLRKLIDGPLSLRSIFEHSTVASLAAHLSGG